MKTAEDVLVGLRGCKALVTGGMGFIGSNLVRRLVHAGVSTLVVDCAMKDSGANMANLAGLDRSIKLYREDLVAYFNRPNSLAGVGCIFHLAAATSHVDSMKHPLVDLSANQLSSLSLLEAIRAQIPNARLVFTSTRQVYGAPQNLPVNEKHPLAPPDVNAIHKIAIEMYLQLYARTYGIRSTTLRLTNTYGPGMRVMDARQMFLGIWISRVLQSKTIEVFGSGNQLRDLNYVDDVVDALLLATEAAADGSCYNIGGEGSVSLLELARRLVEVNRGGTILNVPFPQERKVIDIGDFVGDYRLFSDLTGWRPRIDLDTGLCRTLNYYRENMGSFLS